MGGQFWTPITPDRGQYSTPINTADGETRPQMSETRLGLAPTGPASFHRPADQHRGDGAPLPENPAALCLNVVDRLRPARLVCWVGCERVMGIDR